MRRTGAAIIAAIVTAALLVGCTTADPDPAATTAASAGAGPVDPADVAARYGYDVAAAELTPVYALVPQYGSLRDGYARDLLGSVCLEGVVEYRAVQPAEQLGSTDSRTGQLVFDVEVASQRGYPFLRQDPADPDTPGGIPPEVEITEEIHDRMVACGKRADERLGTAPERLLNEIQTAGWERVATDGRVAQAVEQWRMCMAPAGVIDLPQDINAMPTPSVLGGAGFDASDADLDIPLTDREREVAVADATCRDQVEYARIVHEVRAAAELELIGRNLEAFDAVREEYQQYQAGVEQVIAELG